MTTSKRDIIGKLRLIDKTLYIDVYKDRVTKEFSASVYGQLRLPLDEDVDEVIKDINVISLANKIFKKYTEPMEILISNDKWLTL